MEDDHDVGLNYGAPRWLVEALGETWNEDHFRDLNDTPGFNHVRTFRGVASISQRYEASKKLVVATDAESGFRARVTPVCDSKP